MSLQTIQIGYMIRKGSKVSLSYQFPIISVPTDLSMGRFNVVHRVNLAMDYWVPLQLV